MRRLRLPPHLRDTMVYLVTIITSQLTSFLLLPIITRFLGPSEYGEYALALSVASLIGMIGSSWIRIVGFRFYFDALTESRTRSFYWSMALLQAAALIAAFAVGIWLLPRLSEDLVPLPTLLAAALMMLTSDFQALTASYIRAEKQSGRFAVAEISTALTRLVGTTLGLFLGFTQPAFLFLAAAGAAALGGGIAYVLLAPRLLGPARPSPATMRQILERAPGALPWSVGQWFGRLADRLVLNAYTTTAVVGIYSAGYTLSDRIVGGLADAVFLMAWPDILSSWNDGGVERARLAVRRYFQIFLWLTVGPVVALAVFADAITGLMLGAGYQGAAEVLGLVALAAWIRGLRAGLTRHFELQKRFYALSMMTVAGAALHLVLNLVLVPRYMAIGAGIAAVAAQLALTLVALLIRDRDLVWFPASDALLVTGVTVGVMVATVMVLGASIAGFVSFALLYAVLTAVVWSRRVRGDNPG